MSESESDKVGVVATGKALGPDPHPNDIRDEVRYLKDAGIPYDEIEGRLVSHFKSLDEDKSDVIENVQEIIKSERSDS